MITQEQLSDAAWAFQEARHLGERRRVRAAVKAGLRLAEDSDEQSTTVDRKTEAALAAWHTTKGLLEDRLPPALEAARSVT